MGVDGGETASATAQTDETSPGERSLQSTGEPPIAPGDCVGRYTIHKLIGAGAMGEVFSAHDPELQRLVAIKILRRGVGGSSPRARMRFQREAQAMARLNHPNVVSIHDVGAVGEREFVAMELVDGPTMEDWLLKGRRSPREVVDTFLQAGRGLEAAHLAGIVHRDFKPSNVMLGDRLRVVDFGLARGLADTGDETSSAETVLEGDVTATGARVGTPAYMAPELRAGSPATPLSDQYSFAVSLREALTGDRTGKTVIPQGWLRALVERGTAARPENRYPSMRELLADLERDPARTRRRWIAAGGIAAIVAGAVVAYRIPRAPSCAGVETRLAGIWDPAEKAQVHHAFTRSGVPTAEGAWTRVERTLDSYAASWTGMASEICRATRIEGRQSDSLMDLRMACLERRRSVLGALTSLWAHGIDRDGLDAAILVTLPALDECADVKALTERVPLPSDPGTVTAIAATRRQIDDVQALGIAHRDEEAKAASEAARKAADATGWPEVRAEAAYAQGDTIAAANLPNARAALLDAERLAAEAHDDRLVLRALVRLSFTLANVEQDAPRALILADVAEALLRGIGPEPSLALELLRVRADAYRTAGKAKAARAILGLEYSARMISFGPNAASTLMTGGRVADAAEEDGQLAEARRLGEENLAARIKAFGEKSSRVSSALTNLGVTCEHLGDYDAAIDYYRRAIALEEEIYPPDAVQLGMVLNNLASVENGRGDIAAAEPLLLRARGIYEKWYGPDNVQTSRILVNLSAVRRRQGRFDEARALLQHALEIKMKAYGPEHPNVALTLLYLSATESARGELAAALDAAHRSATLYGKTMGSDRLETLSAEAGELGILAVLGRCDEVAARVGDLEARARKVATEEETVIAELLIATTRCDLAHGRAAEALSAAQHAVAILDLHKIRGAALGSTRWQLARAQAAVGRRAEAVATAQQAEKDIGNDFDGAHDLKELRAWLSAPAPRAR